MTTPSIKTPDGLRVHTEGLVWSATYSFGPGIARSLIVRSGDELIVVSPSCKTPDALLDEVARLGPVGALVAPNGVHHLGLPEWSKRFPHADLYADPKTAKRIGKKHRDLKMFSPLKELSERAANGIAIHDISEHMKFPDLFLSVDTPAGTTFFFNDLFSNLPALPAFLPIKLAYKFTGSGPGLKLNRFFLMVSGSDKQEIKRQMRDALDAKPPSEVIFGHGNPVVGNECAGVRAALDD